MQISMIPTQAKFKEMPHFVADRIFKHGKLLDINITLFSFVYVFFLYCLFIHLWTFHFTVVKYETECRCEMLGLDTEWEIMAETNLLAFL